MRFLKYAFSLLFFGVSFAAFSSEIKTDTIKPIRKSDKEWKESLSPQAYYILRKAGTERAFTGKLYNIKTKGTYICGGCKLPQFSSETKFNSGTGWPSFWQPVNKKHVFPVAVKSAPRQPMESPEKENRQVQLSCMCVFLVCLPQTD